MPAPIISVCGFKVIAYGLQIGIGNYLRRCITLKRNRVCYTSQSLPAERSNHRSLLSLHQVPFQGRPKTRSSLIQTLRPPSALLLHIRVSNTHMHTIAFGRVWSVKPLANNNNICVGDGIADVGAKDWLQRLPIGSREGSEEFVQWRIILGTTGMVQGSTQNFVGQT